MPEIQHDQRRTFRTLDGIRGAAAMLVVSRHIPPFGLDLPVTYLAVDLFFLLSGFVIAHAYDTRLSQDGQVGRFAVVRIIRLYPLYLIGSVLGLIAALIGAQHASGADISSAFLASLFMLPDTPMLPGCSWLNSPAWTLPLELVGNIIYAAFHRRFTTRTLLGVVLIAAIGLVVCRFVYHTLDAGSTFAQLPIGLCRLTFSFFSGVLIHRLIAGGHRSSDLIAWLCLAAVVCVLCVPVPPGGMRALYELALVLLVFPAILIIACRNEPSGMGGEIFRFAGLTSYAVYVLHAPLGALSIHAILNYGPVPTDELHVVFYPAFLIGLVLVSWMLDKFYDAPVRRWLTRKLVQNGRRPWGIRAPA